MPVFYPGNILSSSEPNPGSGMWSMTTHMQKRRSGTWPATTPAVVRDSEFEYTTLLLKAIGANTAQNATFLDSSSYNLSVTRNGDVTQGAFSPYGIDDGEWSAYFDGTGDYLLTNTSDLLAFGTGDYTVEFWVYGLSFASAPYIYSSTKGVSTWWPRYAIQIAANGTLNLYSRDSTGESTQSTSGTLLVNRWYHVAVSRSGGTTKAFLDGTQVYSGFKANDNINVNQRLEIGAAFAFNSNYFNGYISNIRVIKGTALYTTGFTPTTSPLTAISDTSILICQSNRFIDKSTNNLTVTKNGDAKISAFTAFNQSSSYSAATYGGSAYFDGTGDYLTATYSTTNHDWWTSDYTIEAWIYLTTLTGWSFNDATRDIPTLVGNMNVGNNTDYWSFGPIAGGTVRFYYFNGAGNIVTSTETVKLGQWNHIAMTKTSSGVTIFVNGIASTVTAISGTPQSSAATALTVGGYSSTVINGYVSNLRIVKGTAVYSGNFTPPTAPLTAITNTSLLLNASNAGIVDASRKFPLYVVGDAKVSTNVFKYDKSVAFDGTGDYVLVPAASYTDEFLFGSGNFTVETWVRFTALGQNRCLVDAWVSGQSASWQLYYSNSSQKILWYVGSSALLTSTTTPLVDTWYHVAVTRSGTTSRMFINGVLESTEPSISPNYNYKAPLALGVQYSTLTNYLNGYMEDTRITRGVARYTGAFTPPTTSLPTA